MTPKSCKVASVKMPRSNEITWWKHCLELHHFYHSNPQVIRLRTWIRFRGRTYLFYGSVFWFPSWIRMQISCCIKFSFVIDQWYDSSGLCFCASIRVKTHTQSRHCRTERTYICTFIRTQYYSLTRQMHCGASLSKCMCRTRSSCMLIIVIRI